MEPEEGVARLPRSSDVSPPLLHFLNDQFQSPDHLSKSPAVELELRSRCSDLEASISDLSVRLSAGFALYAAHSSNVGSLVGGVISTLVDLRSLIGSSSRGFSLVNCGNQNFSLPCFLTDFLEFVIS
ncbi:hypothetical protein KSP39_PZI015141 [Platanthera zijinensis]|uniref:Uncharacterized protein n=1 Tax=Platanthera zijinensis TaxID=2320716 RepID=A0AAP0G2I3_9ASPA